MRHPASRAVEPKIPLMFKFYSRSLCRRFYGIQSRWSLKEASIRRHSTCFSSMARAPRPDYPQRSSAKPFRDARRLKNEREKRAPGLRLILEDLNWATRTLVRGWRHADQSAR